MNQDPHAAAQKAPSEPAITWPGAVELLVSYAVTFFLGLAGTFLGLLFLVSPFASRLKPPGEVCGTWWIIPIGLSVLVGGSVGVVLGLFLIFWYEVRRHPSDLARTLIVVFTAASLALASLVAVGLILP